MYSSERIGLSARSKRGCPVESEIQIEHRHPRVAHEPQLRPLRMTCHQALNGVFVETTHSCDTRNLQLRVLRTDVRVEPAALACNRVDGDGGIRRQSIAFAVIFRQPPDVLDELAVGGAEIRAAR